MQTLSAVRVDIRDSQERDETRDTSSQANPRTAREGAQDPVPLTEDRVSVTSEGRGRVHTLHRPNASVQARSQMGLGWYKDILNNLLYVTVAFKAVGQTCKSPSHERVASLNMIHVSNLSYTHSHYFIKF